MNQDTRPDPIGRSLDMMMMIIGIATFALLAYDLNITALGKRLAREVTCWVQEQTAPTAPERRDESP